MALIYKTGDILQATENNICHQVNEDGVMGGGLALQIAQKYPTVEKSYIELCNKTKDKNKLFGTYSFTCIGNNQAIFNCFTQVKFVTNINLLTRCFKQLLYNSKITNYSVAIPYKYGCGIAKGNWDEVSQVLEELSNEYGVDISVYKYDK